MKPRSATLAAGLLAAGFLPSVGLAAEPATAAAPASVEAADQQPTEVSGVDVHARRRDEDYAAAVTRVGRTDEAPRDVPQSLTIVTEQLIRDRTADTVRDALRNVSGVTFNAGEGGRTGDLVTIRGYSATGDLYLDGIRDIAQYNREVFNLQQIDVLRGSASVLFGRGSTGGIVNQVSKEASLRNQGEAALTIGSYDYRRITLDVNRRLGATTGARLNLMWTDANSFREGAEFSRYGVAPTVRSGIGTSDEIWVSGYYLYEDNIPDFGIPYYQGLPAPIPTDRFFGLTNFDYETYKTGVATLGWLHRFGDGGELRTVVRAGQYDRDVWPTAPRFNLASTGGVLTDATVVNRSQPGRQGTENNLVLQSDYARRFELFGFSHRLQLGVELMNERSQTVRFGHLPGVTVPTTTAGAPNPRPTLPANFFARSVTQETRFEARTASIYGQDQVDLGRGFRLVLGGRYDDFDADYERVGPLDDYSRRDRQFSWRAAMLYQPDETQTYYVSSGTSFNPSGELYALDPRSANTDPEENRNYEIGARWDLRGGDLSVRVAAFRSEKLNERNTDPLIADVYLLSGRRHTDGVELEVAGRITPRWQAFGGVSFLSARVDESLNLNDVGKRPLNTPDYTASLWTTYQVSDSLTLGGGVESVGERFSSLANTTRLPSYVRWDAVAQYQIGRLEFALNVLNLTDERYYEGLYSGHTVPGAARTVRLTIETDF